MKFLYTTYILLLFTLVGFSQTNNPNKIIIHHADFSDIDQNLLPGAVILTGNVQAEHDGMNMSCDKAYYFEKDNYLKLFGAVHIVQQDTLTMDSKYAEYNAANGFAYAQGEVLLTSPDSTLATDTLKFDRNQNLLFYDSFATITNGPNVLTSNNGRYFTQQKKFQFLSSVTITTQSGTVVKSNHLDYYEQPQHAYLQGPSTVTNQDDFIYTENGFYDVQQDIAKLLNNSYIWYDQRKIQADSIYYDKANDYASASYHVKITDTINKAVITSHFAELFKDKDSIFVTHKPLVAKQTQENDSVYLHAPILTVTGSEQNRVIKAYHGARILRDSMSARADSIVSSEFNGLTQLIGQPVMFNANNQLTGDLMHLINDTVTQQLDSLKVLNNAFVIEKDTIGTGFNQLKGLNLYGKFEQRELKELDLIKNAEIIYYMYNESQELIGIDKGICSHINVQFENKQIVSATKFVAPASETFPEKDLPENARFLRGFIDRSQEKITSLNDIFPLHELQKEQQLLTNRDLKALTQIMAQPSDQIQELTPQQNTNDTQRTSKVKQPKKEEQKISPAPPKGLELDLTPKKNPAQTPATLQSGQGSLPGQIPTNLKKNRVK